MVGIIIGAVVCVLLLAFCIYLIILYNELVKAKNKVQESLSSVDIYLKKRYDLVPNLVETVKAYAKHEQEALAKIVEIRTGIQQSTNDEETIKKANEGLAVFNGVFALCEKYPNLKSDKAFQKLQKSLEDIEDDLSACRRFYNTTVTSYNNMIKVFPNMLFSKGLGHKPVQLFSIKLGEEVAPAVFEQKKIRKEKRLTKKAVSKNKK